MLKEANAETVAVAIGLNRQERTGSFDQSINVSKSNMNLTGIGGNGNNKSDKPASALEELENNYNLRIISIVNLDTIIDFLYLNQNDKHIIKKIEQYRSNFGVD